MVYISLKISLENDKEPEAKVTFGEAPDEPDLYSVNEFKSNGDSNFNFQNCKKGETLCFCLVLKLDK